MATFRLPSVSDWINISTLTGFDTTIQSVVVKNQSSSYLSFVKSPTKPTIPLSLGYISETDESTICYKSPDAIWVKGSSLAPIDISSLTSNDFDSLSSGGIPDDLWTSKNEGYRRLQVDQEQTSFQENQMFRIFQRLVNIPNTSQIVYKIVCTNPIFVTTRKLEIYLGGREYLVYPDSGVPIFTGTLGADIPVYPTNAHLMDGLVTHPVSQVSIKQAIGAGIFNPNGELPRNGTLVLTDGNANTATSTYAPSDDKAGVSAGQSFWLVLNHIGGNVATNGQFLLSWEERFPE